MITINCKLDNNDLYSIVDKEFLDVKMKKVNTGKYVGSEETYNSSFFAIRSLFKALYFLSPYSKDNLARKWVSI